MSDLPTRADYDAADPFKKGVMSYWFSAWPGSEIPEASPFTPGTPYAEQFAAGVHAAVIAAQDSEE